MVPDTPMVSGLSLGSSVERSVQSVYLPRIGLV